MATGAWERRQENRSFSVKYQFRTLKNYYFGSKNSLKSCQYLYFNVEKGLEIIKEKVERREKLNDPDEN